MLLIQRDIQSLGGIASTAELLRRGHSAEMIWIWSRYGTIVRVRKGWYANADVSDDVLRAVRIGGRLACVSAAAHHGLIDPSFSSLHVSVGRHSSRLRTATDAKIQLAEHPDPSVVIHWTRLPLDGGRQAVSPEEALRQMRLCSHPDAKAAIGESAANR